LEETTMDVRAESLERAEQGRGLRVIGVLAVLTAVEFAVAVAIADVLVLLSLLVPIAVAKGWLIVTEFMHVARLWRGEGAH